MYVLGHDELWPLNSNNTGALECIYLRYHQSHQEGYELLHLPTNRIIYRRNVTSIPISKSIINKVEIIAQNDGMPK